MFRFNYLPERLGNVHVHMCPQEELLASLESSLHVIQAFRPIWQHAKDVNKLTWQDKTFATQTQHCETC